MGFGDANVAAILIELHGSRIGESEEFAQRGE
jgi:hypothetical protein